MLTDKVDITCQFMTVTAGRAQQVDFTIPYYREGVGLLLMKNGKYKNFDEVKAAGSAATISILANVYAEELVHQALPEAKVDQYDSVDLIYQALNSGRADAAATDMSSALWFVAQNPDQYIEGGYGWSPQTYSCAIKKGDLEFLHFVDIAFREAMTGVDFPTYCGLVQEVVRGRAAGAAGRLPGRAALESSSVRFGPSRLSRRALPERPWTTRSISARCSAASMTSSPACCSAWRWGSPASRRLGHRYPRGARRGLWRPPGPHPGRSAMSA